MNTILLIEDNPADQRLVKEMLKDVRNIDYKLITSCTLKEGCEQIKKIKIDLILLDLNLPDSTGYSTFTSVLDSCADIPIVLVSGHEDEDLSLKLIKEGAQDYVLKQSLTCSLLGKTIQYAIVRKQKDEEIKTINESLKILSYRLIQIREEERGSISREIHDQIGQALTSVKIDTFWLLEQQPRGAEEVAKLNGMIDIITGTILDVQRISSELRPAMLDDIGLSAALEWYCEEFVNRTGLKVNMEFEKVQSENMNANLSVYRVLQESLTNIIRHSGAKNVLVKLSRIKNNLVLLIHDDGIGISKDKINSSKSLGILGMLERIRFSGGQIGITTPVQGGTQIRVNVPYE